MRREGQPSGAWDSMPSVRHIEVSQAEAGHKLLQFLERRLSKAVPRALMMKWLRKGQVRVDGRRAKPFDRLEAGQTVRVPPHEPGEPGEGPEIRPAQPRPLPVVHEDEELLVIAKPAGLASQPGSGITDSVQTRLKALYAGRDFVPSAAHRLDMDTSGLMVAGKTYRSLRRLGDLFATGGVDKTYLAWVKGEWPESGTVLLQDRIVRDGHARVRIGEHGGQGEGKLAAARVRPIVRRPDASLLEVELLTGRMHQIRIQLASRGHPVLGDRKYGRRPHATHLLLHAWKLKLPEREFRLPPDWPDEYMPPGDLR